MPSYATFSLKNYDFKQWGKVEEGVTVTVNFYVKVLEIMILPNLAQQNLFTKTRKTNYQK